VKDIHDRFTRPEAQQQHIHCINTHIRHTGVGVVIKELPDREKVMRVLYLFPPGVTCSAKYLNENVGGDKRLLRIF
jgi:hypothetical protein